MAGVLFLLVVLLGVVNLVQKTQETRKGAAEEVGTSKIKPNIIAFNKGTDEVVDVLIPGNSYDLQIFLNPVNDSWQVRAAGVDLFVEGAVLEVRGVYCSSDFPSIARKEISASGASVSLSCYRGSTSAPLIISAEGETSLGKVMVFVKPEAQGGTTKVIFSRTNIPNAADENVVDLAVENRVVSFDVVGDNPPPEDSINIEIASGQVNPNPAIEGVAATYYVGEYTDSWKTSIHYYYGDQPVQGNSENICCGGYCENHQTASSCRVNSVQKPTSGKLWFFANLTRVIDGVQYICDWEGNWKKLVNGDWVLGSPGEEYVCANTSLTSVEVQEATTPVNPTRVSLEQGEVSANPVIGLNPLTYTVGEYNSDWKTSIHYYYGDQPTQGSSENICCGGYCDDKETTSSCEVEVVDQYRADKIWFFANLTKFIGGKHYICDWESNWKKWDSVSREWILASPGEEYTCENSSLTLVDITDNACEVSNLTIQAPNQGELALSWDLANGEQADGIKVQRWGKVIYTSQGPETSWNDTGLVCGNPYEYRVFCYVGVNSVVDRVNVPIVETSTLECPPECPKGDLDDDCDVDNDDIAILGQQWSGGSGSTQPASGEWADFNGDISVNETDLTILLNNWTGPKN